MLYKINVIQPYNKLVSKCVCFLGTFQKYIFEILELIFHVILIVPKCVPFDTVKTNQEKGYSEMLIKFI
ncbi:hypothetical protein CN402_15615 [Bacillus sp. AFS015896]|nr:hypothetical protein CN402_15615 [Bacillus sp. AFS015896]